MNRQRRVTVLPRKWNYARALNDPNDGSFGNGGVNADGLQQIARLVCPCGESHPFRRRELTAHLRDQLPPDEYERSVRANMGLALQNDLLTESEFKAALNGTPRSGGGGSLQDLKDVYVLARAGPVPRNKHSLKQLLREMFPCSRTYQQWRDEGLRSGFRTKRLSWSNAQRSIQEIDAGHHHVAPSGNTTQSANVRTGPHGQGNSHIRDAASASRTTRDRKERTTASLNGPTSRKQQRTVIKQEGTAEQSEPHGPKPNGMQGPGNCSKTASYSDKVKRSGSSQKTAVKTEERLEQARKTKEHVVKQEEVVAKERKIQRDATYHAVFTFDVPMYAVPKLSDRPVLGKTAQQRARRQLRVVATQTGMTTTVLETNLRTHHASRYFATRATFTPAHRWSITHFLRRQSRSLDLDACRVSLFMGKLAGAVTIGEGERGNDDIIIGDLGFTPPFLIGTQISGGRYDDFYNTLYRLNLRRRERLTHRAWRLDDGMYIVSEGDLTPRHVVGHFHDVRRAGSEGTLLFFLKIDEAYRGTVQDGLKDVTDNVLQTMNMVFPN